MRFSWDRYAIPTAVSRCGSVCPIKVDVYSYSSVRCILSLRIRVVFKLILTLGYHTSQLSCTFDLCVCREGEREREREGGQVAKWAREGGREGGREGEREGGRKGDKTPQTT